MDQSRAIAPIIIKKKRIIANAAHHGGAWKVAYADFVTAMMAFFMLMWLMNATTEKQRKGLADYFSPTIPVIRISGGGDGMFGGDSVFSKDGLPKNGTGVAADTASTKGQAPGDSGVDKSTLQALKNMDKTLNDTSGNSAVASEMLRHIQTRVTDAGLIVDIFDLPGRPLFEYQTDRPQKILRQLTEMIASVFAIAQNKVAISAFNRSFPIVMRQKPGWSLSTNRADRVMRLLQTGGLDPQRMGRVAAFSDRVPAVSDPMSVKNNRLEIILLRSDISTAHQ